MSSSIDLHRFADWLKRLTVIEEQSEEKIAARHEAFVKLLKKHRIAYTELDDGRIKVRYMKGLFVKATLLLLLQVLESALVEAPYTTANCQCSNLLVMQRLATLLDKIET